jgi:cation:H+ antiporter
VSLAIVFAASQLFVRQLEAVGAELGLSASVTALLLSPVATELPEVMNAIIWVRQGKTRLA